MILDTKLKIGTIGLAVKGVLWLKRKTVKSETTMVKTGQHMDSIK